MGAPSRHGRSAFDLLDMNDPRPAALPFPSQGTGILRPGRWLALRALVWAVPLLVLLEVGQRSVQRAARSFGPHHDGPFALVSLASAALVALLIYLLAAYVIERRTPYELALRRLVPELAAGLLFGTAMFAVVMGVLVAAGAFELTGPTAAPVWHHLAIALESGVVEELLFRGVIFRLLWTAFGAWWGLAVSSALFGLAHLINPNTDILVVLGLALEAGLMLGGLFILTGRLWAPIGFHIAWNFSESYLFGARISGLALGPGLFRAEPVAGAGPLWTGGLFGPEASLPSVLLLSLTGAALIVVASRKQRSSAAPADLPQPHAQG